jgi:hypothetical protein
MINFANNLDSLIKQNACWKGYEQVGMKMLGGKEVPNCVPASKDIPNSKPKKKKTEKKASENAFSQFIADVPMVCTPGIGCKRKLTEAEKEEVENATGNIIPNLFPQDHDPVSSLISSPEWAGVGTGLLGAVGGGILGGAGAQLTNNNPALYSILASILGGLGGGVYGYMKKRRRNAELKDLMKDLPVGGDIGDIEMYSDPKRTASMSRDFHKQLLRKGLV